MYACSKCYCTKLGNELLGRHRQWSSHYLPIFFVCWFTGRLAMIDVRARLQQAIKTVCFVTGPNWPWMKEHGAVCERLPSAASFPLSDTLPVKRNGLLLWIHIAIMIFLALLDEGLVTSCAVFPLLLMVDLFFCFTQQTVPAFHLHL